VLVLRAGLVADVARLGERLRPAAPGAGRRAPISIRAVSRLRGARGAGESRGRCCSNRFLAAQTGEFAGEVGMHEDPYQAAVAVNAGAQLSGSRRMARAANLIA
jgi:hypothetical protein